MCYNLLTSNNVDTHNFRIGIVWHVVYHFILFDFTMIVIQIANIPFTSKWHNKIPYFDILLFLIPCSFSHTVWFCWSNLLQVINCYKIKGERSKEHVVCECEQARFRTRKFHSFQSFVLAIDFGNNDNWHIKTISCQSNNGETLARKRICGLRKCRIFSTVS